jgi:hypothetical protein
MRNRIGILPDMKHIGYWRQRQDSPEDLPWPIEGHLPQETKEKIARYLSDGKITAHWRGWSTCRICGKMNGSVCKTDGEFEYPEGYAHYILDHNIQPDGELLAKVLTL